VSGCDEELFDLAHEVSGLVDLIIAGGDGVAIDTVVAGVPVVQALGQGRGWAVADLLASRNGTPWRLGVERLDDGGAVDSAVAAVVARHAEEVDSLVRRVVARVRLPMPKSRRPSALSRLVADAFRNGGRTDLALVPLDMLGAGLEAGRVRYGDLFQVLPMRRQLTVVEMTGDEFTEVMERAVSGTVPTMEVSGVTVRYDPGRDPGDRVREVRLLDGRKIRGKDVYSVAVPDVMTHGPDAVAPASSGRPSGLLDVDVLALYLTRLPQPVEPPRTLRLEPID
jgi:2',3'-cyclic-nucleotide 2'-phosphodiesterase (5'-nucleotidase family)